MRKIILLFTILCLSGCAQADAPPLQTEESTVPVIVMNKTPSENFTEAPKSISSSTLTSNSVSSNRKETNMNPDRITYKPDFYYEPLSEDIKTRITGHSYATDCLVPYDDLRYVSVQYYNFDGKTKTGEIICNKNIAQDLVEIFYELYEADYPIEKIRLIDEYNADDELSCLDNNTSSFNYRVIAGTTKLSKHAQGLAIDINPLYNPYITYPDGVENIFPYTAASYADRNADFIAKITHEDLCYQLFTEHGFTWGGDWNSVKDYQHFEK